MHACRWFFSTLSQTPACQVQIPLQSPWDGLWKHGNIGNNGIPY